MEGRACLHQCVPVTQERTAPATILRTLDNALCPKASAADRKGCIADTVFFIGFRKVTATAETARCKDEIVQSFPIGYVFRSQPKVGEGTLGHVPKDVLFRDARFAMQVTGVSVHQRPARTDISIPCDGHGAALHEVAGVIGATPVVACEAYVQLAVERLKKGLGGNLTEIHFRQAQAR